MDPSSSFFLLLCREGVGRTVDGFGERGRLMFDAPGRLNMAFHEC
jgi:hypothetical protein